MASKARARADPRRSSAGKIAAWISVAIVAVVAAGITLLSPTQPVGEPRVSSTSESHPILDARYVPSTGSTPARWVVLYEDFDGTVRPGEYRAAGPDPGIELDVHRAQTGSPEIRILETSTSQTMRSVAGIESSAESVSRQVVLVLEDAQIQTAPEGAIP